MEVRKDLREIEVPLQRLAELAEVFNRYNHQDWSHLANREDFDEIYGLDWSDRRPLEKLYSTGRDWAISLSNKLISFNYAELHPTLSHFVDSLNGGWVYDSEDLKQVVLDAEKKVAELKRPLWSISQMIELYRRQLELNDAARVAIDSLKCSDMYISETQPSGSPGSSRWRILNTKLNGFHTRHPMLIWLVGFLVTVVLGVLAL